MSTIKDYNNELVNSLTKITLTDYFKNIHSEFYPDQDISFMKYFLELSAKPKKFCVNHDELKKYGVINNIERSNSILKCINQYKLEENIDYRLHNVVQPAK